MLLYKYKSSSALLHLLDIVVNERLYCQEYSKLNDPFEGQFRSLISYGGGITSPIVQPIVRPIVRPIVGNTSQPRIVFRDVAELPYSHSRVCSLSSTPNDVRMWSLYADSHQGVAVEIDFSGLDGDVHEVSYVDSLPKFGSTILTNPTAVEVLTCKTNHWDYEREYRIVGANDYFDISNRIRRVILGLRTPVAIESLLARILPAQVLISKAELDHEGVSIRIGQDIFR